METFQQRLMAHHATEFAALDITMAQAKLLYVVATAGELSMSEIAVRLGVTVSTSSGAVERLVELGLVARSDDPNNRRQVRVSITETGSTTLGHLRELNDRQIRSLLESVNDDDLETIERASRIMAQAISDAPTPTPSSTGTEDHDVSPTPPSNPISRRASMSPSLALATHGLRKSYGTRLALDGLELSVPTGVVYGFLGPNGAGKTTTMRVLTGLIHADGGSMELLGRPFTGRDRQRLFDVGALVETPRSIRTCRVVATSRRSPPAEPVSPRPGSTRSSTSSACASGRGDKVSRYSLGMKQRLGIAGALLNDPALLLLDEPANGLDPAGIVAMRETLRHLASIGKTVFISSHLLAEVQQMADVVGIIAAGRLVREGSMQELLHPRASSACVSSPRKCRQPPPRSVGSPTRIG